MKKSIAQHTKCLLSGSQDLKPLKGYESNYLVKSRPLGFVFCSRIPTEEELKACYEGYERNEDELVSELTVKRYHELLDGFEKYRKTGKILDVGCGVGLFLREAKKRGWEVYGTEYTETAIQLCRDKGINMQEGKLNPALYEPDMFDVITSFEVLEHINNPQEEIRNIKSILRPEGVFYFTTPNFNALERYLLKDKYNVIQYPEHLCYYTKKTIHYLLSCNGFRKKKLLTNGFSLTRLKTSRGKKEALIGKTSTDEAVRKRFESNSVMRLTKTIINNLFNLLGTGASLKGWYVK